MNNNYPKAALNLANVLLFLSCFMIFVVVVLFGYRLANSSDSSYSLRGIEVSVFPAKWDFDKMKYTPLPSVYVYGKKGDLEMKHSSFQVFLLFFLYDLIFFVAIAISFYLLRKLFQNIHNGELYSGRNIKLLYKIGWILIITPVIDYIILTSLDMVTVKLLPPGDQVFEIIRLSSFRCSVFVSGFFLLGLLKVFERGLELKQENDLTV
jgi:hypothetical protein